MNILFIGKFPPIQGGVSASSFLFVRDLARKGHHIHVLTNANAVESGYRQNFTEEDQKVFQQLLSDRIQIHDVAEEYFRSFHHIPFSQCFSERLFGKAMEIMNQTKIDLIMGWYFQPYAFVAAMVGNTFNIPYIVNHAGSDVGRLSKNQELRRAYQWMLSNAKLILSRKRSLPYLLETFGKEINEKVMLTGRGRKLPSFFKPSTKKLEIKLYSSFLIKGSNTFYQNGLGNLLHNEKELNPAIPTIGIYGKLGITKGTYDLISCLDQLSQEGLNFQFLILGGGNRRSLKEFETKLGTTKAIKDKLWYLPFIPYFRVPEFIKRCDITCFLERDFPIPFHSPGIPLEVLSVGSCLLCSKEIIENSYLSDLLIDQKNFVQIDDPKNHKELCDLIRTLLATKNYSTIGQHGYTLATFIKHGQSNNHPFVEVIESK